MSNSSLPYPFVLVFLVACPPVLPDPPPEVVSEWGIAARHVALFNKTVDEDCPEATHASWSVESLFRSGEALKLLGEERLPEPLERFCTYTWLEETPPEAEPSFDPPWDDKLVRIDPDRDVLMPQAPYLGGDETTRDTLAEAFRRYSGTLGSGVASHAYDQPEATARVAVIDSVEFADAGLEYASAESWYRHGLAMAELVHTARCPNDDMGCRERQFHAQAFPYVRTSPQVQAGGGPLGSIGSLAHALGEAVIRWQTLDSPDAPLILNLSVAWDPAAYGGALTDPGQEERHIELLEAPGDSVEVNVQAVHAVLVYASCLDALAIAASGNNTGAPCDQIGAMAPAMWEGYRRPDPDRCERLFGELPERRKGDPALEPIDSSVVYAASGVTAYDLPIPVARPDSNPPRALLAFQAVVGADRRQTDAYTGTSVSAATLSGIAASIWTHRPTLTPAQVIDLITSSGSPTDLVVAPPLEGEVRRITGHAAFDRLCETFPNDPACINPYLEAMPPASVNPQIYPSSSNDTLQCTATPTSCGDTSVTIHGCNEAGTAPVNVPAPSPWLRPQPEIPYCPVCPVRGGKLTLSLNPDHVTGTTVLDNPTLEFRLADGSYVRAGLGQITVDETVDAPVDLATYTITIDGEDRKIAEVLSDDRVTAATLGIYVPNANGVPTRTTSPLSVGP